MIIHGRGFLPPAPEHCDGGNELAPATKVGKAEGAISRLQQKLQLEYKGWKDGEAGRATDFRGLPSSARGFLFPSDQVCQAVTPQELGLQSSESLNRWRWSRMLD